MSDHKELRERAQGCLDASRPLTRQSVRDMDCIRDLLAALDDQQKVIEKLPMTKDGVRVVPMTDFVYSPHHNLELAVWANGNAAPRLDCRGGTFRVSDCYSTREAAEAAREGES